jgi:nickel/cobalt transporter (NicO) family protein
MDSILIGSLTLSLLHALIPSHWLPFVTIGRTEGWSSQQTLTVTAIAGLAHTVSTTLLGGLVSLAGWQLAENYHNLSERAIPLLLLALGMWYLMQHLRHHHVHDHIDAGAARRSRSFSALLLSLGLAMFLSPCLEIEAYFLSAGAKGWGAVALVALIYNVITLSGMLLMVKLARHGLQRVNAHWFEHNENLITSLTLIGLAVFNFFIEF